MSIKLATRFVIFLSIFFSGVASAMAQSDIENGHSYVDNEGVLRWSKSKAEIKGFGVNYTVPFAHAYRTAKRLGVDVKQAMENDVYHFKRLGFDLYRVHVWDTEISDAQGNLVDNEHLDSFDYLISLLKEHHINYVITPIAYWGNGWPEPDEQTAGFSAIYGKSKALTDANALKAQKNYLQQFLNHTNKYTELTYAEDPSLIALEISNEPHHRGTPEDVTAFIRQLVRAIKSTGTKVPIFYNTSHAVQNMEAYFKAGINGGTFQWYPTGLGYQKELEGNFLPNVDNYDMPFNDVINKFGGAKIVYEFDAADIGKSYIYPAIARSFRTAGIQLATQFAYDPTFMADVNTEYNTHYMNLAYTPKKALALKIASEVFRKVPLYKSYGNCPNDTVFDDFYVDYEQDLAVYNEGKKFFYTNSNSVVPKNSSSLKEIAGYGNSEVVLYNGAGAYFLDKIENGIWRLEVMPDAIWVNDPFGKNSPDKTVGVIKWRDASMTLNLPDLGGHFHIKGLNKGNSLSKEITEQSFVISPGTYLLEKKKSSISGESSFKGYPINSFYAPANNVRDYWMKHHPPKEITEGEDFHVEVQFVGPNLPAKIKIEGYTAIDKFWLEMHETTPYHYSAVVPKELIKFGHITYYIIAEIENEKVLTFPGPIEGLPSDWDFYGTNDYKIRVMPKSNPIYLFDATNDSKDLVRTWREGLSLKPGSGLNESEYQIHIDSLYKKDPENLNAVPIYDYSLKHFVIDELRARRASLSEMTKIVVKGRSLKSEAQKIQIALVQSDGSAYGGFLELKPDIENYSIALKDLNLVKTVLLPRPYPSFLPYYFSPAKAKPFNLEEVESLQISVGPGLNSDEKVQPHGFSIISVKLE